jgi:hypothetical protein
VQYTSPLPDTAGTLPSPTPAVRPAPRGNLPVDTPNEPSDDRTPRLLPAPPTVESSLTALPAEPTPGTTPDLSMQDSTPNANVRNGYPANELFNTTKEPIGKTAEPTQNCPSVKDLLPISKLGTDITTLQGEVPKDCPWGNEEKFTARSWRGLTYTWTASALCHKPLYFEDEKLERYGHMWGPWLQPIVSHARFFATVPILPYEMGLETPNECMYALGYYRPGNCAPYYLDPIPLSVRAALFEGAAWTAGVIIIP